MEKVLRFFMRFRKLREATISYVMSVCLSLCLCDHVKKFSSHWTDIGYLSIFRKFSPKIHDLLKSDKSNGDFI